MHVVTPPIKYIFVSEYDMAIAGFPLGNLTAGTVPASIASS
jgi:hypothetical protein